MFIDDSDPRTLPIGRLPMVLLFLAGQRQFIRGLGEGYGK